MTSRCRRRAELDRGPEACSRTNAAALKRPLRVWKTWFSELNVLDVALCLSLPHCAVQFHHPFWGFVLISFRRL